jgi:hypothetical protein|tara:strand:+ start:296 stop:496 length:201 start_codon:yes stop_codon:yes gene_type:complete
MPNYIEAITKAENNLKEVRARLKTIYDITGSSIIHEEVQWCNKRLDSVECVLYYVRSLEEREISNG